MQFYALTGLYVVENHAMHAPKTEEIKTKTNNILFELFDFTSIAYNIMTKNYLIYLNATSNELCNYNLIL